MYSIRKIDILKRILKIAFVEFKKKKHIELCRNLTYVLQFKEITLTKNSLNISRIS